MGYRRHMFRENAAGIHDYGHVPMHIFIDRYNHVGFVKTGDISTQESM